MPRVFKRYRQGDVVLKEVCTLSKSARPVPPGPLAVGEQTGHTHRFADGNTLVFWEGNGRRFIEVVKPAALVHEEHAPLTIQPGVYEQLEEREYDYINERAIIDND